MLVVDRELLLTAADDAWLFAGACDGPGRIPGRCFGHRITVEAPPELVWRFVADFAAWASWNPLSRNTMGEAEEGAVVAFTVRLAGHKPRRGKALIHKVDDHERLEFRMSRFAGLLKIHRFVEVEELSPVRCRVANGEIIGGPLGPLVARSTRGKVADGLWGMNEALKDVAERRWRGPVG